MATEVTRYVDPDVVGGAGDGTSWANAYSSLETAQSTEAKDLTSSDEIYIFECRSSGGTADTTTAIISAWTCDATRYVKIFATDGQQALKTGWDSSRYRLISVYSQEAYIEFVGLQVYGIAWSQAFKIDYAPAGWVYIHDCYFECVTNSRGIDSNDSDIDLYIWNTIVKNGGVDINKGNAYIYNSIFYGCVDGIYLSANANTIICKNIACFNNGDDFDDAGATSLTIDYCASDDGDGTNAVAPSGSDWDNEYLDSANGDFTLVSGGNCEGGGTDDPSSGLYSTDMDGDSYSSPWSIGVDEPSGVPNTAAITYFFNDYFPISSDGTNAYFFDTYWPAYGTGGFVIVIKGDITLLNSSIFI